jgi:ribose transport system substrate-binding protein
MVACITLVAVAALASTSAASAKNTKKVSSVAYGDPLVADASFAPVRLGFISLGKKIGVHVYVYNNAFDASTALSNAQLMVERKPTVVADWNAVASIGASLGRVFKSAHQLCIAINTTIPGCPFFNLEDESIGLAEGTAAGQIALSRGWKASNTTVIMVDDPVIGFTINSAIYGFYTNFAKDFPGMKQMQPGQFNTSTTHVGNLNAVLVNGDVDLQGTYTAVTTALETIPKTRHVVIDTLNDDSALGGLRALTQAGRANESDAIVVGNTTDTVGLHELRTNPVWAVDSSIFFNYWPNLLVAMADAMLNGVTPPKQTIPPQVALTKANVNTYYRKDTQINTPKLPKADAYLLPYLSSTNG